MRSGMKSKRENDEIAAVLNAWRRCRASTTWPRFADTVSTASWRGRRIASIAYRGECFDIFDLARCRVVPATELPGYVAETLDWKVCSVRRVAIWRE